MEFYERVSGARMHSAFYRPNAPSLPSLPLFLIEDICFFVPKAMQTIDEIHLLLVQNKIWKQRLVSVGQYGPALVSAYGLTGVMARSAGVPRDVRLSPLDSYANYNYLSFSSYLGQNGDAYDRYLLRVYEMLESLQIANQVCANLLSRPLVLAGANQTASPYKNMEVLIAHFKYWSEGLTVPRGLSVGSVESPKGEFAVTLVSDGTGRPFRCKIRSPAFFHLQALSSLAEGGLLADLVTLIGTVDIVFGEIDR